LPVSHLAYGLHIETDIAIPGLTVQPRHQATDLQIHLKEPSDLLSAPPHSPSYFLYSSPTLDVCGTATLRVGMLAGDQYYGFFYADGARFAIDREGREIWADWPENYTLEDACTYLVGPILAFALRLRGATCLHASAIAVENRALILMGAPGAGKSTTAAAFAQLGFPVLSDDVVVLVDQGDRFLVQPGYPRVNLWPDSVHALFGSKDALPCITLTWPKRFLALDQDGYRFRSSPLPLGRVYFLGARKTGLAAPLIEEVTGNQALMMLVSNAYGIYLLDRTMQRRDFDLLSRVVAQAPVRQVRPPADPSEVYALCRAIASDAKDVPESTHAAV
jgi:hypothetical protein